MNIFLDKVKYEIRRAAEYLKSNVSKHPEGYRVQIESLQDSVSLFHVAAATKKPRHDEFSKVLAHAQSMLQNLEAGLVQAEKDEKLAALTSQTNSSGVESTVQCNLVEIPKFCGDGPLQFRPFMNLFMDRINLDSSLKDIAKFILLRNNLEGEAYDVINEIPITENSFLLSLNLLEEMYGDEEKCIDTLFDRMKTLPAVSTGEIAEIRQTYWKLEAILRSLEQYGELVNESGFLQSLYLEKFANVSGLKIEGFSGFQFDKIRELVRSIIQTKKRNISELFLFEKLSSSNDDSGVVTNELEQSKTETAFTDENISSVPSNEIFECIFCLEKHCSEDCLVYPTVFQRKKQIQHLCLKCLQFKHGRKPCVKYDKCDYCDENSHNRILCPLKCRTVETGDRAPERLSDILSASLLEEPKPILNEPLTESHYFRPTTPLTTCTDVEWPKSGKKTSVRLVMASGSPISIISETAAARLGIKYAIYEKSIVLLTVMGDMFRATHAAADVLIHVSNAPPVQLRLHIVEKVCDKTVVTPTVAEFKKEHPHLADMDFPDTGCGLPIEMLIGGDTELASFGFNSGFNGEECPPLNSGWSLVSSRFGWLIVGTDTSDEPVIFTFSIQE